MRARSSIASTVATLAAIAALAFAPLGGGGCAGGRDRGSIPADTGGGGGGEGIVFPDGGGGGGRLDGPGPTLDGPWWRDSGGGGRADTGGGGRADTGGGGADATVDSRPPRDSTVDSVLPDSTVDSGPPCSATVNVALTATATSSGGGKTSVGVGPDKMVDGNGESNCNSSRFHWLDAPNGWSSSSYWLQLTWSSPVTIGRVSFDTIAASSTRLCGLTVSSGRSLAGGTLQYRKGSSWVTITTVTGQSNDWSRTFIPVTTTAIRLANAHAHTSGYRNPLIIEWRAFCK